MIDTEVLKGASSSLFFLQGLHLNRQHDVRPPDPDGHHARLDVPHREADADGAQVAQLHLGAGAEQEEAKQEHHSHADR